MLKGGPRWGGTRVAAGTFGSGRYGAVFYVCVPQRVHARVDPPVPRRRHRRPRRGLFPLRRRPRPVSASTLLLLPHHGGLPGPERGRAAQSESCGCDALYRCLPDDVPGRGGIRARQDRAADGVVGRTASVRTAERPFAPRVHGRGAAHLRRLSEPPRRTDVVHRSRRRARGAAAHAPYERAGYPRRKRSRRRAWSCPSPGTGSSRST